jgi:hypothetical protein
MAITLRCAFLSSPPLSALALMMRAATWEVVYGVSDGIDVGERPCLMSRLPPLSRRLGLLYEVTHSHLLNVSRLL